MNQEMRVERATWKIPSADAYGGVLLSKSGYVLLREPTNHFDGYVWTFPKGKPDSGETPYQTALREVWEETGCRAEVLGALPDTYASGLSKNAYFLMSLQEQTYAFDWETQTARWVSFEEARQMIQQTTNIKGRQRDLKVLEAAETWFHKASSPSLPAFKCQTIRRAAASDWDLKPFSGDYVTIPLTINFSAAQSQLIKMGFIPSEMEQKWFTYFDNNILYQHHSWSGLCVDRVYFKPDGDGLRATHAEVSQEAAQSMDQRYAYSSRRIEGMLCQLADPTSHQPVPSPFAASLEALGHPNYLGSPNVVDRLLTPYLDAVMNAWLGLATSEEKNASRSVIENVMSGNDSDYLLIKDWHTREKLGSALVTNFNLDPAYCDDEGLMFVISEAMAALAIAFSHYRELWIETRGTQEEDTVDTALAFIFMFARCVLMGTNDVFFPGVTLHDFSKQLINTTVENVPDEILHITPPVGAKSQPIETTEEAISHFDSLLHELNKRQPPFTFDAVGIQPDTVLHFTLCPAILCVVKDHKRVIFQGKAMSLSQAALLAMASIGKQRKAARGPDYWLYEGMTLTQRRQWLEQS